MKILWSGKNKSPKKKRIIRCKGCGCIFIATIENAYIANSVLGIDNYYVDCPECERSNLYQNI